MHLLMEMMAFGIITLCNTLCVNVSNENTAAIFRAEVSSVWKLAWPVKTVITFFFSYINVNYLFVIRTGNKVGLSFVKYF